MHPIVRWVCYVVMGLFQKKSKQKVGRQGREDMQFRGVLKKAFVEIPGDQLKRNQNFQGCSEKLPIRISIQGARVLVFELGIYSKECHLTQFCRIPTGESLFSSLEFLKVTNLITPEQGFQKSICSTPIWIFSEIVHVVKLANFYHQER